jgi:hypothetical protein
MGLNAAVLVMMAGVTIVWLWLWFRLLTIVSGLDIVLA